MPQNDVRPAMKRRPLDLNSIRLSTVWRGYDPADVDRFLRQAASDYESALRELDRLAAQHAALDAQLADARGRERELGTTLSAARESADAIRRRATLRAGLIDQEARTRAGEVVKPALSVLDKMRSQIEQLVNSRRSIEEMLARTIASLQDRRSATPPSADGVDLQAGPATGVGPTTEIPAAAAETPSAAISLPVEVPAPLNQPKRSGGRLNRTAVPLAIAAAVAATAFAYLFRTHPPSAARPAPSTAAVPATPDTRVRADETLSNPEPASRRVPPAPQRAQSPPGTRRLIVVARRECWLRAIADGRTIREGLMRAGEEIPLEFRDAASIRAGDAGAVSMTLDGQPLGPLGGDGQVVTRRFAGRK